MGYTTDFFGKFEFNRPLTQDETKFINGFSTTRRMTYDPNKLMEKFKGKFGKLQEPFLNKEQKEGVIDYIRKTFLINEDYDITFDVRRKFNLRDNRTAEKIYGSEGQYYVGENEGEFIVDYNTPPKGQPGLWCQWITNGNYLEWDGGEKFYNYIKWLKYLIKEFFEPWGVILNGEVEWEGDDSSDFGKIIVTNNIVTTKKGRKSYE